MSVTQYTTYSNLFIYLKIFFFQNILEINVTGSRKGEIIEGNGFYVE